MGTHDTAAAATVAFTASGLSALARRPADRPQPASAATQRIADRRAATEGAQRDHATASPTRSEDHAR